MKHFSRLWLAAALLFVVATPTYAQNSAYGLVTQIYNWQHVLKAQSVGAGSVRLSLRWAELETADNVYDANYIAAITNFLDRANEQQMHILLSISDTPAWANGGQGPNYPPTNMSKFYEVMVDVLSAVGDRQRIVFGIWNEPNLDDYLQDNQFATVWAQLWQQAVLARAAVNKPHVRLAGPETSFHAMYNSYYTNAIYWMTYYGYQQNDVITVHWYNDASQSLSNYMNTAAAGAPANLEMWLTEAGHDSANETTQANTIGLQILNVFANRSLARWTKTFVYQLNDHYYFNLTSGTWYDRSAMDTFRYYAVGSSVTYPSMALQSYTGHFLSSANDGCGTLDAAQPGVGDWERFDLVDRNGGALKHLDVVSFHTNISSNNCTIGTPYGGGGTADAAGNARWYGSFILYRHLGPGNVANGDQIYLRSMDGLWLVAENGGGGVVNANRVNYGPWERFTLTYQP